MLKHTSIHPWSSNWSQVVNLYQEAFPKVERMPIWLLYLQSLRPSCTWSAYYDDDQLAGFSYLVTSDNYAFVFYLAVNGQARGRGYGSQILTSLKNTYAKKEIIINIEPLDDQAENHEQRLKRLAFYEKNGWQLTEHHLTIEGQTFAVMSQSGQLNETNYLDLFASFSLGLVKVKLTKARSDDQLNV